MRARGFLELCRTFPGHSQLGTCIRPAAAANTRAMLVIDDLTVRIAGLNLIDGAAVQVPDGARVGLVGRNGAGKSTLFRVLAGDMAPDHGAVILPARARIGRLPQ